MADRFRYPWRLANLDMDRNASELRLRPHLNTEVDDLCNFTRTISVQRAPNDPRQIRYHAIELGFFAVDHQFMKRLNKEAYFFRSAFPLKLYQFDYPRLSSSSPDFADADDLHPANYPIAGTCASWYVSLRGVSNDAGDGPYLYVNGALVTTGFTWDYAEGKVTFTTPLASSTTVQAFYVWKPSLKIVDFDPNALVGKAHLEPRFSPTIRLEQL